MEHIFIINAFAGKGGAEEWIQTIEETLKETAYNYSIYRTQAVGDTERFVKEICAKGEAVRFYVCGGDGTLHEAVNGARNCAAAQIGVFPMGTGNDFIRNFGKKADFMDVLAQVSGTAVFCDAIALNGRYVVNMANIGFDCEVVVQAQKWKKVPFISGTAAYVLGIFSEFIKPMGKRITFCWADGKIKKGKYLLCTIANGKFCGGGFCSSPKAVLNDGLMDVGIVKMLSRGKFIGMLPKYKSGTYLETKLAEQKVTYIQCDSIEVEAAEPTNISIDGEIKRFTYIKAEMVPHAFQFIIPSGLEEEK